MTGYLKLKYLLVFSFIINNSCNNPSTKEFQVVKSEKIVNVNQLLTKILVDSLKVKKKYAKLFYLSENGCHTCNKSFSHLIQTTFSDSNLYVVNASGMIIDISFFQDNQKENIVFDDANYFVNNGLGKSSSVIFMKNNKVDTLVKINSKDIERQFDYIFRKK